MSLLDGVDVTNPCAVWPKLQEAYYRLLAGDSEVRVRFRERETELNRASMPQLKAEITRLRAECERRSGGVRARGIRAGYAPRCD